MGHAALGTYSVLAVVSVCCPHPEGRLFTCYSPVCHSIPERASSFLLFVRLACVKHAASVRPEPGSNSPWQIVCFGSILSCLSYSNSLRFLFSWNSHIGFFLAVLFSFQRTIALSDFITLARPFPSVKHSFESFWKMDPDLLCTGASVEVIITAFYL